MENSTTRGRELKTLFGRMGTIGLLLIIPIKLIRWLDLHSTTAIIVGIAPSLLGPAGLLFLIASSSGKLSRLTLAQVTVLVTVIALGIEFVQLLPRPGILAKVQYTFDWLDVIASGLSVCVGYLVARFMTKGRHANGNASQ